MKAKFKNIGKAAMPAIGLTAGAVAAGFINNFIPEPADPTTTMGKIVPKVKPFLPLALGILLMTKAKKGITADFAAGLVAGGGKMAVNSFGIGFAPDPISYINIDGDSGAGPDPINGTEDSYPEDEMPY